MNESDLVVAARNGDRKALEELLTAHYDGMYHLALKITKNADDALDAVQTASMKVCVAISSFEARAKFKTWFWRILVNECIHNYRNRRRRQNDIQIDDLQNAEYEPSIPAGFDSRLEAASRIRPESWKRLTDDERYLLVHHYAFGETNQELAKRMGIGVVAVKSRIFRARLMLLESRNTKRKVFAHSGRIPGSRS